MDSTFIDFSQLYFTPLYLVKIFIKSIAQFYKLSIKSMYYTASLYKNSYFIFASLVSIIIVTGPSFKSSTFISAPKTPVSTLPSTFDLISSTM